MTVLGRDNDGVTSISLEALSDIAVIGKQLEMVEVKFSSTIDTLCTFIFEDKSIYVASGFAVGYGGEGPRGLHKAIRLFCPNEMDGDFSKSGIASLTPGIWYWKPDFGFVKQ